MTYAKSIDSGPLGKRINYHYFDDDDMVFIRAITYGSLASETPINQVSFEYTTPTRRDQGYVGGESFMQNRLLSRVTVLAHDVPQRHYVLDYNLVNGLGYQRVNSLQEFNGAETRALDPITFSYGTTPTSILHSSLTAGGLSSIASNNATIMTADLTGSGGMDFLLYTPVKDFYYRFYDIDAGGSPNWGYKVEIGKFVDLFTMKALSAGSRLYAGDGLGVIRNPGTNQYKFQCYIYVPSATVPAFQYEREWTPPLNTYYSVCEGQDLEGIPRIFKFVSGDFNGDGLSDIMAISRSQYTVIYEYPDPENPTECEEDYGYTTSMAFFINMDRRITNGYVYHWGETEYQAGEFSQTVGYKKIGIPSNLGIDAYNDLWGDGGDRYRTSRTAINFGLFGLDLTMFTGDPGLHPEDRHKIPQGPHGTYQKDPNDPYAPDPNAYRAGILSLRIGRFSFGLDHEKIRNFFQNTLVHRTAGYPYFEDLSRNPNYPRHRKGRFYWRIGAFERPSLSYGF